MDVNETESGVIINIQKFSLHDGPGIRTVVFFKGCPLTCKWCSNPESQSPKIQILWDGEKCVGCGSCLQACPQAAIAVQPNEGGSGHLIPGKTDGRDIDHAKCTGCQACVIDHAKCTGCQACVEACPNHALKAEGERKSVAEIVKICLQDRDFYEESSGGVTLSGGEVLMHPGFAISLLNTLRGLNIHTALETTGFASQEIFDRVTELADLLLFDMKHWDGAMHLEGTGVSNVLIKDNLKRSIERGKLVLPRIPVIPGFNDTQADAFGFVRCLEEVGAKAAQLLPFHQFGERKYELLGKTYGLAGISALHEDDLEEFRQVFIENGIHAFF